MLQLFVFFNCFKCFCRKVIRFVFENKRFSAFKELSKFECSVTAFFPPSKTFELLTLKHTPITAVKGFVVICLKE